MDGAASAEAPRAHLLDIVGKVEHQCLEFIWFYSKDVHCEATVRRLAEDMLEALEDAGADMMFDCRKGECGLCEVRILELVGAVDHRDVFYSTRQKNATEKMEKNFSARRSSCL